jgi:hypothetical protein
MTPTTLRFAEHDTRESALQKAGVWYDRILDEKLAAFATAIGKADVSCDDMLAGIQQARVSAAKGRAPFLAEVAGVLDEVIAIRRSQ